VRLGEVGREGAGAREREGGGGPGGGTRREAASAETAAVRRRVSAEPSREARGTPVAELKRETAAWTEGRRGELAGKEVTALRAR
jgi:hypothetical protein